MEAQKTTRLVLWGIVLGHWLLGLISGLLAYRFRANTYPSYSLAVFIGLMLAQTSLLAIWASLGANRLWVRGTGLIVAVAYLIPQFGLSIDELEWHVAYIVVLITLLTAVPLLGCRCFGYVISSHQGTTARDVNPQFSIRYLMLLTLAVAVVLAVGRQFQRDMFDLELGYVTILAAPFIIVGVGSVWAILAYNRPILSSTVLLIVALGLGLAEAHFVIQELVYWMLVSATHVLVLSGTLMILWSRGYRLHRGGVNARRPLT